ncbi:DUF4127 family protein [Paludicola sp. MB14-C6]|uniref:DUF4127 family protein n=1 Tax=Paludihabitans sp. MB14-C6 TaxID=3070656 RepID=UPI0027DC45F4|nr:DUF4127 family protein [Paludicola sp. MB14-C6]WMJ22491.1 DUF4127 family protein [Paludicola sp. MB14-C6]
MRKILLLPLDERPCNYDFTTLMVKDTDVEIVKPPKDILGKKKKPGDIDAIFQWTKDNIKDCDGAIIAIDTLIYSSILASRLHHFEVSDMIARLEQLKELKAINPKLTLFAYTLIMRNPQYSSSDEEPDYYEQVGREIHRFGVINHKLELGIATDEEKQELADINAMMPKEYLNDYLQRRIKNIEVNKRAIELTRDGVIDFLIVPQDDSSPYGLTAKDQQIIRQHIRDTNQQLNVYMYPDADAVANTLLARLINQFHNKRPLVYLKYASALGDTITPLFEDRVVNETIKYQVLAAGGLIASSVSEADIILMINTPSANPQCHEVMSDVVIPLPKMIEYDANRNLIEQVEYADYAINVLGKEVVFADIAYANGGDPALFELLRNKGLLFKLSSYAGWNTSSNTLGTCIPHGMIHAIYGDRQGHADFLALRYVEDVAYMCFVIKDVTSNVIESMGYNYFHLDGQKGEVAKIIREKLSEVTKSYIEDANHAITILDSYQPWNRMFEVGLSVKVESK